jgi:hypothetical protein
VIGENTPTRNFERSAFVVNVPLLLAEEFQDIIDFESGVLGVSGHRPIEEYVVEKLRIERSITAGYGRGSQNLWYGAVGPAVTIRDFYKNKGYEGDATSAASMFRCFGGVENAYVDAMLVKNSEVQGYLEGKDVPVTYVQFRMFSGGAKAHTAPWGLTQTYFQMNDGGTAHPNVGSGGFTTPSYGTVSLSGDAVADMTGLLELAKSYNTISSPVYWWPTILATETQLGLDVKASLTGILSGTGNIFESYDTDQHKWLQSEYAGYSLVGILVYAIQ